MIMEIIKTVLEQLKLDYTKLVKDGAARKRSENAPCYRKSKSKTKFDYMHEYVRKNS